MSDERWWVISDLAMKAALQRCADGDDPSVVMLEQFANSGDPTEDTHPENVWVWADGNYFDAVVIHREWKAYQQA